MTTAPAIPDEPDGAPRIAVLDILRGIAILGILFMNINDMGQSLTASFADIRHLGWTPADQVAWWLREILANGTARCLLEMLFGAGMVILTDRTARAADDFLVMQRYYVRNSVLFGFGLAHLFVLLWPGDILHSYAIAGLIVFLCRRMPPRLLLTIGLFGAISQLGGAGYFGYYASLQDRAQLATVHAREAAHHPLAAADRQILQRTAKRQARERASDTTTAADIAAEDRARSAGTWGWMQAQWAMSRDRLTGVGELFSIGEAASTMLIGAALFRLGILQGARTRRFYLWLMLAGYGVGAPLRTLGAWEQTRFDDAPQTVWATEEVARLAMTLGHLGLIQLLVASVIGARLLRPFAAAGRTALSIYVLQTIVTLWILFPPFGFALYGRFGWALLMGIAVAIDLALLWLANVYLQRFRIAPVEWAWRSILEWRLLPFRREAAG